MTQALAPEAAFQPVDAEERREIEDFLFKEARLADESRYTEWEALVEDDMFYWIPRGDGDWDRRKQISITADNRSRLANRIRQLNTGNRHAQLPPSPMRRLIANLEVERSSPSEFSAAYNFSLYEMRVQSTGHLQIWAGRMEFRLRRTAQGMRMFYKRVSLVNGNSPIPSIAFLL
jgi:benzoate/toluate 1,2-dioxygenase beta subunit